MQILSKKLKKIWEAVPVDYYQRGIKQNLLQRMWHKGKLQTVLGLMNGGHDRILDIGCASGWLLSQISVSYPKAACTGIDIYKNAIKYGNNIYKKIKFIHGDAHSLPFPNNSFDVVVCTEVLEHVLHPKLVLKEIKRVLTKDGIAIIEMDSGNLIFNLIWWLWTDIRKGVWNDAHLHSFNTRKLENMIIQSGFIIKKRKTFNFSLAVAFRINRNNSEI